MPAQPFKVNKGTAVGESQSTHATTVVVASDGGITLDSGATSNSVMSEYTIAVKQGSGIFAQKILGIAGDVNTITSMSQDRDTYEMATTWVSRNALSQYIMDVAYGNGVWVAVGDGGQLKTSTDTVTWTTRTSNMQNIFSVEYADSKWVIGGATSGYAGAIRTSTDAVTWVTRTIDISTRINDVQYFDSKWVAVGGPDAGISYSTDAVTWVSASLPGAYGVGLTSVTYGNGAWVAAGSHGGSDPSYRNAWRSTDAVTWTSFYILPGAEAWQGSNPKIAYGNGTFAVVYRGSLNAYFTSTDTLIWTRGGTYNASQQITFGPFVRETNELIYTGEYWIAAGYYGNISVSTDALTWFNSTITGLGDSYSSNGALVKQGTTLLAGGAGGGTGNIHVSSLTQPVAPVPAKIAVNPGISFEFATNSAVSWPSQSTGIYFLNNQWIQITNNFFTSTDAVTWVTRTTTMNASIFTVAYGNGTYVVAGNSGQMRRSTDAVTWVTSTSNFGTTRIKEVAYGNGLWVAVGYSGQIRTSTDAITWTTRTSNTTFALNSVTRGDSQWVAVGANGGQIRSSTDGITWVTRTNFVQNDSLGKVAYGNGTFVAIGYPDRVVNSTDGITWTSLAVGPFKGTFQHPGFLVYQNGIFVAAAYGKVKTSADGVNWTTASTPFEYDTAYTAAIAYGQNKWIMVGGGSFAVGTLWKGTQSGLTPMATVTNAWWPGNEADVTIVETSLL